jgi:hypothetical protein
MIDHRFISDWKKCLEDSVVIEAKRQSKLAQG